MPKMHGVYPQRSKPHSGKVLEHREICINEVQLQNAHLNECVENTREPRPTLPQWHWSPPSLHLEHSDASLGPRSQALLRKQSSLLNPKLQDWETNNGSAVHLSRIEETEKGTPGQPVQLDRYCTSHSGESCRASSVTARESIRTAKKECGGKNGDVAEGGISPEADDGGALGWEGQEGDQESNSPSPSRGCNLCRKIWELQREEELEDVSAGILEQLLALRFVEEDIYYHQILINNGYLHLPNSVHDCQRVNSFFSIQAQPDFVWEDIRTSCVGHLIVRDLDGKIWFTHGEYSYAKHVASNYAELKEWLEDPSVGVFEEREGPSYYDSAIEGEWDSNNEGYLIDPQL